MNVHPPSGEVGSIAAPFFEMAIRPLDQVTTV